MSIFSTSIPDSNVISSIINPLRWRWWGQQSSSRQDRYAMLAPLISITLFLIAMAVAFWYLRNEEREREYETVKHAAEIAHQQIHLLILNHEEQFTRFAQQLPSQSLDPLKFQEQALAFLMNRPELKRISWFSERGTLLVSVDHSGSTFPVIKRKNKSSALYSDQTPTIQAPGILDGLMEQHKLIYTLSDSDETDQSTINLTAPLQEKSESTGAIKLDYTLSNLIYKAIPVDILKNHTFTIINAHGVPLISTTVPRSKNAKDHIGRAYELSLPPPALNLKLRAQGWRTPSTLLSNMLFWMVVALSCLTVWMLLGSWLHIRKRHQIQDSLIAESNFRRAMENSILTGMRAVDMQGCITYVNRAFCEMTGFSEHELIGCTPPYPHWVPERLEETMRFFQQEIEGKSPLGGIEVLVKRKDGEIFDARMYVSPLIDAKGKQTGWMTSMTNITESKRIRDQLTASHERFTTVLEGLDASVSVVSDHSKELLFANRSYKLWFSGQAEGHILMSEPFETSKANPIDYSDLNSLTTLISPPSQQPVQHAEIYIPSLQKWLDVRSRLLQWTDGRMAQMLIATDITARHRAEEQAQQQAEKAQVTSRLITMGEMASSVAHELNQPLAAISNYCNGMVSRVKADRISSSELITALEKTSRQAERAGQIIHRIRAFVKRSEPNKQRSEIAGIVEDAIELANISLKRRKVQLHTYLAQRIPDVWCDPILIEQVILNLVKNASEAIDDAHMPPSRRSIELRVAPKQSEEEGHVIEFSVTDSGPGMLGDIPERIYEAFFSTKTEGMGIGLSLCRSIIESHRGRMRATNLYNGDQVAGCRFTFTLPVEAT
jgi:PAS domain S-box-containing protein